VDVEAHRFWLRALSNASNAEQMIMDNIETIQRQLDPFDEGVKFYSKCDTELSVCIFLFLFFFCSFCNNNINSNLFLYFFIGLDVFD